MKLLKRSVNLLYTILDTVISILELLIRGRLLEKIKRESETIIVAGNGPSLLENLEIAKKTIKDFKLAASNFYLLDSRLYNPDYYYLLDDRYFQNKSNLSLGSVSQEKKLLIRIELLYDCINNHPKEMTLFVPKNKFKIVKSIITNPLIKIKKININTFNSSASIRHFIYNRQLGLPKSQTVIIAALFYSLHISKKIYLAGCDSSWIENLSVNKNNEVISILKHNDGKDLIIKYESMMIMLETQLNVFKSYEHINLWAKKIGAEITNLSSNSYIDVFNKNI
tara:strand:+ start:276 stop:1118 length:843 start_codon:yes stop_codon:yes gene_type:complete